MKTIHIAAIAAGVATVTILLLIPQFASTEVAYARPLDAPTAQQDVHIDYLIQRLINCESLGHNIKVVDSNGYYSYGILMFQKSTWDDFSQKSGIVGSPMKPDDAITMARWAIEHGYIRRWTCARILHLIP